MAVVPQTAQVVEREVGKEEATEERTELLPFGLICFLEVRFRRQSAIHDRARSSFEMLVD
jgi:hypothetical protein